jgi:hypothetical protein
MCYSKHSKMVTTISAEQTDKLIARVIALQSQSVNLV